MSVLAACLSRVHRRGARTVLRGPRRSNAPGLPGGLAPLGYDAAVLHAYALAQPETAAEVREVFADVLDTDAGRLAHLIICAEIVQAAERDALHARLAPYARRFAAELLTAR